VGGGHPPDGGGGHEQGGHAPPSSGHAGHEHDPAQLPPVPEEPPAEPPPLQAVAPLLSVVQHPVPNEVDVEYEPGGHAYAHEPELLPVLPPLLLPLDGGGDEQLPDPSSVQHERGSGYVVAPGSHCVKGAPGYVTQEPAWLGPAVQHTLGWAEPVEHAGTVPPTSEGATSWDPWVELDPSERVLPVHAASTSAPTQRAPSDAATRIPR